MGCGRREGFDIPDGAAKTATSQPVRIDSLAQVGSVVPLAVNLRLIVAAFDVGIGVVAVAGSKSVRKVFVAAVGEQ